MSNVSWSQWGQYFGFPACCIKHFCENAHVPCWATNLYGENFMLNGTGYVACPECMKKTKEELIDIINKNRYANYKFNEGYEPYAVQEKHIQMLISKGEIK